MRLISWIVRNTTIAEIAAGEGIKGKDGEKPSDAFEIAITLRYYQHGFESVRAWLYKLFDKYVDIAAEVRKILTPSADDKLLRQVQGALRVAMNNQHGKITDPEKAAKLVVANLRDGQSL